MRGHEALIAMRLKRQAPAVVFIDFPGQTWRYSAWRDWHFDHPQRANLELEEHDNPEALDLRCIRELTVFISDTGEDRVEALRGACIEAGAGRVVACCLGQEGSGDVYTRYPMLWCTDTRGAMTWPK
jgi:hypothetical protein